MRLRTFFKKFPGDDTLTLPPHTNTKYNPQPAAVRPVSKTRISYDCKLLTGLKAQ